MSNKLTQLSADIFIKLESEEIQQLRFTVGCTGNCLNNGNKSVQIGRWASTSLQNSFNAPWHRFYKCLELYWKDVPPFFHEKFHNLVFC
jgi:hypothetical protein